MGKGPSKRAKGLGTTSTARRSYDKGKVQWFLIFAIALRRRDLTLVGQLQQHFTEVLTRARATGHNDQCPSFTDLSAAISVAGVANDCQLVDFERILRAS